MASTNFTDATASVPGTPVVSAWLNEVNTATHALLTGVAGANTITAVGPPSMTAYETGQRFFFNPAANNTSNVTININGLGARAITKLGNILLITQDLLVGTMAEIVYDGAGFQLLNPQTFNLTNTVPAANLTGTVAIANGGTAATTAEQALINLGATGRLLGMKVYTSNTTYTPTPGTTRILAQLQGGGGAGGGSVATAAAQISCGGGGGAGGYSEAILTSGFSGAAIVIGAGGTGVTGGIGNAGGTTSFAGLTATGGGGGHPSGNGSIAAASGGAGGSGTGGTINLTGASGNINALNQASSIWLGASGAGTRYGSGGATVQGSGTVAVTGSAAVAKGSGGGGGLSGVSSGPSAGGAGAAGLLTIYEYS